MAFQSQITRMKQTKPAISDTLARYFSKISPIQTLNTATQLSSPASAIPTPPTKTPSINNASIANLIGGNPDYNFFSEGNGKTEPSQISGNISPGEEAMQGSKMTKDTESRALKAAAGNLVGFAAPVAIPAIAKESVPASMLAGVLTATKNPMVSVPATAIDMAALQMANRDVYDAVGQFGIDPAVADEAIDTYSNPDENFDARHTALQNTIGVEGYDTIMGAAKNREDAIKSPFKSIVNRGRNALASGTAFDQTWDDNSYYDNAARESLTPGSTADIGKTGISQTAAQQTAVDAEKASQATPFLEQTKTLSSSGGPNDPDPFGEGWGSTYGEGVTKAGDFSGISKNANGGKIVCSAMNEMYGFGYERNIAWLKYSQLYLKPEHAIGYHFIFKPLVKIGFKSGNKWYHFALRKTLEHIATHRTDDLNAEMRGTKRDAIGMIERFFMEPMCYAVGKLLNIYGRRSK